MTRLLAGNGRFDFDIVGESHRQETLAAFAGPKKPDSCDVDCLAALVFDDENAHDNQAVAVMLLRRDETVGLVGYLPRTDARKYRTSLAKAPGPPLISRFCRAKIVGGWSDTGSGAGHYGVKLDLVLPLKFMTEKAWETWYKRLL